MSPDDVHPSEPAPTRRAGSHADGELAPRPPAIQLQPFTRADFARLIGWIPNARFLLQWSGPAYTFPLDEQQLVENQWEAETEPPRRHHFRALETATGEVVGHIELVLHRDALATGRLARVLIGPPAARGRGLGAAMVGAAVDFGFGTLGLAAIDLAVFSFNRPAIACYRGLGFQLVQTAKRGVPVDGEVWTGLLMRQERAHWEAGRAQPC